MSPAILARNEIRSEIVLGVGGGGDDGGVGTSIVLTNGAGFMWLSIGTGRVSNCAMLSGFSKAACENDLLHDQSRRQKTNAILT